MVVESGEQVIAHKKMLTLLVKIVKPIFLLGWNHYKNPGALPQFYGDRLSRETGSRGPEVGDWKLGTGCPGTKYPPEVRFNNPSTSQA